MEARWVWIGIAGLFALGALGDIVEPGEETVVPENSIFRTEEARDRLMGIYDERMADWPVPYEELDLETSYGTVHVIASGPADGEPVLLLHASGLSATSWGPNIEAFAGRRTYAIDQSNGGFVSMSYAIEHPERVSKLILPGPMGLTPPPLQMGLRLLAAQFIHWTWVEQGALTWILGTSPIVLDPYGEWFTWVMRGSFPRVVPPVGIPAEDLAQIEIPVLLFLGTEDNLVGDPDRAAAAASVMKDLKTLVVESSHLVNVEVADEVNRGIVEFLAE